MTSLYQIAEEYKELLNLEDVPEDAIANTLEGIKDEFDNKAVALLKITTNWQGEILQIDEEINRLLAQKSKRVAAIQRLKDYLRTNMEKTGINKIDHPLFSITLQKAKPMVEVLDVNEIPVDYVDVEVVTKLDKRRILSDLKKGIAIAGVKIGESIRGLIIK